MTPEQFELSAKLESTHWWYVGRRNIVERFVRYLVPPNTDEVLLDIGCGTGGNIGRFVGDYRCVGIDVSSDAIRLARSLHPEVRFECSEDVLRFAEEVASQAGIILLLDVLEHIENDKDFLSTLAAVMHPGAYLMLTVPANMSLWSPHDVNHGHYRRYEYLELMNLLQTLPVRIKLVSYFNTFLYPMVRIVRVFTRRAGRSWGSAGTDLSEPPWPLNKMLMELFSSEARFLVRHLKTGSHDGWRKGVSLLGIIQRT